jgi:uncharacterized membrane protein
MKTSRILWIVLAILFIYLVVRLVLLFRQPTVAVPPEPPRQPSPADEAYDATREMIEERTSDTNYVANLNLIASRYADLNKLRSEAMAEMSAWMHGFLASNAEARAISSRIQALKSGKAVPEEGETVEALEGQLKAMVAADPFGAWLLDKADKISTAIDANQRIAADYIGGKVREQAEARKDREMQIANARARERLARGEIKPVNTNWVYRLPEKPVPRRAGWWTNDATRMAPPAPRAPQATH